MRLMIRSLTTLVLTMSVLIGSHVPAAAQTESLSAFRPMIRRPIARHAVNGAENFVRTELFFGTAKPDGVVTEEEFIAFLDQEVTPRFPDGLTLLKGDGQFRGSDGVIIKEDSFLLILLYPLETFRESSRRIEAIRRIYRRDFQQESVLRVDDPFAVRVSF